MTSGALAGGKAIITLSAILFMITGTAAAWEGTCRYVLDGDSIVVRHDGQKVEIRLYGIDAPEFGQEFGKQARQRTRELAAGKRVTVEPLDTDVYGRTVAKVYTEGGCLNERLVENGCAWVFRRFCTADACRRWLKLEQAARTGGLGLWARPDPVPPWQFRRTKQHKKKPAEKQPEAKPADAPGHYRGNTASKIFHRPGCTYYDCKTCTAGFNSMGAALRSGYRPCKACAAD